MHKKDLIVNILAKNMELQEEKTIGQEEHKEEQDGYPTSNFYI